MSRPDAVGQALWLERIKTAQADVEHAQQHLQEVAVAAIADGLPRLVICQETGIARTTLIRWAKDAAG